MKKPIRVLFVCLGNICRSPMAEAIFQHLVKDADLEDRFEIDSAGTSAHHQGQNYHRDTRRVCDAQKTPTQGKSRPVEYADLQEFDYILAMDQQNYRDLQSLDQRGTYKHKIFLLRKFSGAKYQDSLDVPDPYYGGPEGFDSLYKLLLDACQGFLAHMQKENLLR